MNSPRYFLELLATSMIWGSSFMFLEIATPEFGPIALIAVRTSTAILVLLPLVWYHGEFKSLIANWAMLIPLGLMSTALPFTMFSYASVHATSGYISLLNGTVPIFSAIIAFLWLKESMRVASIFGIALGFAGIAFLSSDGTSQEGSAGYLAIVFALLASFSYALTASFYKRFLSHLKPIASSAGCQLTSSLMLLPFAYIYWPEINPSMDAWGAAVTLGVLCTAIATLIYYHMLNSVGIAKTVVVTYLIPIFALMLGVIILDEVITQEIIIGGSLVLVGVGFITGVLQFPKRGQS